MRLVRNQGGQALTEFALASFITFVALALSAIVLRSSWLRAQCSYLTFEAAHLRLMGRSVYSRQVQTYETERAIESVGHCGTIQEKVTLPKLEYAQW